MLYVNQPFLKDFTVWNKVLSHAKVIIIPLIIKYVELPALDVKKRKLNVAQEPGDTKIYYNDVCQIKNFLKVIILKSCCFYNRH